MAKDTRTILDGRSSLRVRGMTFRPGQEDQLQAAITASELESMQQRGLVSGDGWEAGLEDGVLQTQARPTPQQARLQHVQAQATARQDARVPYADLLMPVPFVNEEAVRRAADSEILAVNGIGPQRLAEVRAYFKD